MNRKKPRGLRIKKPILTETIIKGTEITYWEWRCNEWKKAPAAGEPIWTQDGYWEVDIIISADGAEKTIYHQVLWNPKEDKWISGEL